MKHLTVTVNGVAYDVTVEETAGGAPRPLLRLPLLLPPRPQRPRRRLLRRLPLPAVLPVP